MRCRRVGHPPANWTRHPVLDRGSPPWRVFLGWLSGCLTLDEHEPWWGTADQPSFRNDRSCSAPVTVIGSPRTKASGVSTSRWLMATSPSRRVIRKRPLGRYPTLVLTASDAG